MGTAAVVRGETPSTMTASVKDTEMIVIVMSELPPGDGLDHRLHGAAVGQHPGEGTRTKEKVKHCNPVF